MVSTFSFNDKFYAKKCIIVVLLNKPYMSTVQITKYNKKEKKVSYSNRSNHSQKCTYSGLHFIKS